MLSDTLLPDQGIMEGTDKVPDKSSHDSEDGGHENEVSDTTSSLVHSANQVCFPRRCLNNALFHGLIR
jgi:hypothetical protein